MAMPQPMLGVVGVEDALAWPLPGAQARQVLEVARSNGGGADACSVPPRLLTWGNATAWDEALHGVVREALKALGVKTPTKAELSALQIHSAETGVPEGSLLTPRPDSWGSLVVQLPALHEGGALELSHEGETLRFGQAGMAGAMSTHWAAFYAAGDRTLTPVTSGRRLSLLYSLCRADKGPPLLPPSQAAASRRFERLEKRWVEDEEGDAPQKLVYFFEKQSANPQWDRLEGDDRSVVEALLGAKHDGEPAFDLFLATFTVSEFKRTAGGWQEESNEADGWEAHPDLDMPEVVVEAAEALGWPGEGEIVQGDTWFEQVQHGAACEDSEDESEEEDEDDHYQPGRGRYGYGGYDDYDERERHDKANKQRRTTQQHALVLWPRRTRARVLSLEGVIGCAGAAASTIRANARSHKNPHAPARPRFLSLTLRHADSLPTVAGSSRQPSMATAARSPATQTSRRCRLRACSASTSGGRRCSCACSVSRSSRRSVSTRALTRSRG